MSTMRVIINSVPTTISAYTDQETFMLQYASDRDAPVRYFHTSDHIFSNNPEGIRIVDVREVAMDDARFSNLNERERLIAKNITNENAFEEFSDVFPTFESYLRDVRDVSRVIDREIDQQRFELKRRLEIEKQFTNEPSTVASSFEVDTVHVDVVLEDNDYTMMDIFDSIKVSEELPYIRWKHVSKVYDQLTMDDRWLDIEPKDNHIFFIFKDNDGVFESSTMLSMKLKLREGVSQRSLVEELLSLIDAPLDVSSIQQVDLSGEFLVFKTVIELDIFAYLIYTDTVVGHVLSVDESNKILTEKNKIYVLYSNQLTKLSMTIRDDNSTRIRVSGIENEKMVSSMVRKILTCMDVYHEQFNNVVLFYKKWCTAYKPTIQTSKGSKKVNTSARDQNKRIQSLQKYDPNMFGGHYSVICQGSSEQPRIIDSQEAANIEKIDANQVIEFPYKSDTHYTCEPIEAKYHGSAMVKYKYPGLRKNRPIDLPEYSAKYPYLPCCYPAPQKDKDSSAYYKYMKMMRNEQVKEREAQKKTLMNVLNPQKVLPSNRLGNLTYNVKKSLQLSAISTKEILRLGFDVSGSSILACVSHALKKNVTREKLAESSVQLVKQSFYASSIQEIRDYILSSSYLEPEIFVPLIEEVMDVNIFLFVEQEIIIPRYIHYYISHPKRHDKSIVIHARRTTQNRTQCELLVHKKGKKTLILTKKQRDELNKRFFKPIYDVHSIPTDNTYIVRSRTDTTAQIIDSSGKARAFVHSDGHVSVPPLPTYPGTERIVARVDGYKTTLSDAVELLQSKVTKQYTKNGKTLGVYGRDGTFIPCVASPPLKIPSTDYSPLEEISLKKESLLSSFRKERLDTELMKMYAAKADTIVVEKGPIMYLPITRTLKVSSKKLKNQIENTGAIEPYMYPARFSYHPNQIIFIDQETLVRWYTTRNLDGQTRIYFSNTLDTERKTLYYASIMNGPIISVQNIETPTKARALYASYMYATRHINTGYSFNAEPVDATIKIVSTDGTSIGDGHPIIKYDNGEYAAILI